MGWLLSSELWRASHKVALTYELEDEAHQRFLEVQAAVAGLGRAAKLWRVEAEQANADW